MKISLSNLSCVILVSYCMFLCSFVVMYVYFVLSRKKWQEIIRSQPVGCQS